MGVFDQFWVLHSVIPNPIYLVVLSIINLIIIILIVFVYYVVKGKIIQSMKGPSKDAIVETPEILYTIKLIAGSLISLEISNVISHLSPLIFSQKGYLFIGLKDVISVVTMMVLFSTIIDLSYNLSSVQIDVSYLKYKTSILKTGLILYMIPYITLPESNIRSILQIAIVVILLSYLTVVNFKIYIPSKPDKVAKARMKILFNWTIVVILFYVYFIYLALGIYGTVDQLISNQSVELAMIFNDLIVITTGIFILLVIYFPEPIRELYNISKHDLFLFADFRFDHSWDVSERILDGYEYHPVFNTDGVNYLLTYQNISDRILLEEIREEFLGEIIKFSKRNEETLRKFGTSSKDMIFIDTEYTEVTQNQLKFISKQFQVKISIIDGVITIRDKYQYKSDEYVYSLLCIYPPIWNVRRKLWLVNTNARASLQITDFLTKYRSYFEDISTGRVLFAILRFPVIENKILPIPSSEQSDSIPDQDYIEFL